MRSCQDLALRDGLIRLKLHAYKIEYLSRWIEKQESLESARKPCLELPASARTDRAAQDGD